MIEVETSGAERAKAVYISQMSCYCQPSEVNLLPETFAASALPSSHRGLRNSKTPAVRADTWVRTLSSRG